MKNSFFSLSELWDFVLEKRYNRKEIFRGFVDVLKKHGLNKSSLILDAGCGSGFMSLDLAENGFRVVATDKSYEMIRQVKINAQKKKIGIQAEQVSWSDLSKKFDPIFDFVYCRGNSLIYAASWEQNWIVPDRNLEEIKKSVKSFYNILRPGGWCYIDSNIKPYSEKLGVLKTRKGDVEVSWKAEVDSSQNLRTWTIMLKYVSSQETQEFVSYSAYLSNEEICEILHKTGFKKVEKNIPVHGEKYCDVFIAQK